MLVEVVRREGIEPQPADWEEEQLKRCGDLHLCSGRKNDQIMIFR